MSWYVNALSQIIAVMTGSCLDLQTLQLRLARSYLIMVDLLILGMIKAGGYTVSLML